MWAGGTDLWSTSGRSRDPWRRRQDRPVTPTTVLVAALWRWLASGLCAGAVGGTLIFPIVGTVIGGAVGLLGAAVPAVLAAIVLRLGIRPGMDVLAYRRLVARIHCGLLLAAVLICGVAGVLLTGGGSDGPGGLWTVALGGTLVPALGFLWWNGWTLIGLGPPVAGRGSGVVFVGVAAGSLIALAGFGALEWWDGGRAGQEAAAEDLAESVLARFDATADGLDGPGGRECPGGDPWIHTSGIFRHRSAQELAAVAQQLEDEGWSVEQGVESGPGGEEEAWFYAERDLDAIAVEQHGEEDTRIKVSTGCATEQLRPYRIGTGGG